MKKAITLSLYAIIVAGLLIFCWLAPFPLLWQIIFSVAFPLTLFALFLTNLKFNKPYKTFVMIFIIELIFITVYSILFYTGLLEHFSSQEAAQAWFESFGAWAWIVFFLIEFAQVLVIPMPAQITTVAGVLLLGAWKAFFISEVAIISGSMVAFAFGKIFGDKIAYKIAQKETVEKYKNVLTRKGILLLPIMFLFPLFPDDLLCFLAGSTAISWSYFVFVTLITRTIGIACTCFFLSGSIIPFSGWGIPVWIVIAILLATACILLFKYQDIITDWIIEKFGKKSKEAAKIESTKTTENNANVEDAENKIAEKEDVDLPKVDDTSQLAETKKTKNDKRENKE